MSRVLFFADKLFRVVTAEYVPSSDETLLVKLGSEIALETHQRVFKLLRLLEKHPIPEIRNLQPAYCSLLIQFDALKVHHEEIEAAVQPLVEQIEDEPLPAPREVEIPICYGHYFGPDLELVAQIHRLPVGEVVRLHSEAVYTAYFIGFIAGFAYLGGLPRELMTRRLDTPRKRVEPGSVGIAGGQTAVYPFATPGGWNLLGRTPLRMFRPDRNPMPLISIGDRVRFRPIAPAEFFSLAEAES